MSASHQTTRFGSRDVDLSAQCDEIEKDTVKLCRSVGLAIRAAIQPIEELPLSLSLLEQAGRKADIPKLGQLVQSIARDQDKFIAEKTALDAKFESLKNDRPTKKGSLSRYSNSVSFLGHEYIDLNQRIAQTMGMTIGDYFDLIQPLTEPAEAVS